MTEFLDLKIDASLLEHLAGLGYRSPTQLQREAIPVISRGTNAIGIASAGSGKTLAYAVGLAPRLDPNETGLQALVLRPTDHAATRTAETLHQVLHETDFRVKVLRPGVLGEAHIACAAPASAVAALERSALKLDRLRAVVVDGASAMIELDGGEALETLSAHIPKDAQRITLTDQLGREVEDWLDRHARRARRLAYLPAEPEPLSGATLEYYSAPRNLWLPALVQILMGRPAGEQSEVHLRCRFAAEGEQLVDRLVVRGVPVVAGSAGGNVHVEVGDPGSVTASDTSISWGVPADHPSFLARVADAGRAIVFAEPRELAHLKRLAGAFSVRLSPLKAGQQQEASRSLKATQDRLRDAATHRDLEPYSLLLEPLLEEFSAAELAAAATALLRERTPEPSTQPLPAWTRLYFGVGRRDGVRPADLVGAITGESSVSGDRIGRIEIRDTFSAVEVAAPVADQVIKALAGATIRGRPTNVRVFRE